MSPYQELLNNSQALPMQLDEHFLRGLLSPNGQLKDVNLVQNTYDFDDIFSGTNL